MCKKINILSIIVTTILLASCATLNNKNFLDEEKDKTKKEEEITISDNKKKAEIKTLKKSEKYLETNINYPYFDGKDLLNKMVENSILSYYNEFEKAAKLDWEKLESLEESSNEKAPFFYGTSNEYYEGKKITCVLIETEIYTGGAHGSKILNTYNYDNQDKEIKRNISELSGYTYEELSILCRQKLYKQLAQNGNTIDKDWIDSGTEPYPSSFEIFLIKDDSVEIFFEPYTVASYAEGVQKVELKLKK